jgi:hypothetical protein
LETDGKEFGLDRDGDIIGHNNEAYFVKEMEKLMPKNRIIKIEAENDFWVWYDKTGSPWTISNDMIARIY